MNKTELIAAIASKADISKKDAKVCVRVQGGGKRRRPEKREKTSGKETRKRDME